MPVNPFSEQDVTHARQQVQIQAAVLQAARAQLQNAREQVSGRYHGLDANIASLKSQILRRSIIWRKPWFARRATATSPSFWRGRG